MRCPRLDFPGARHYATNLDGRRGPHFVDDIACAAPPDILGGIPQRVGVRVHAHALMSNPLPPHSALEK